MTSVIIIGLGYVGLPLARSAMNAGHRVIGLDISHEAVNRLNAGRSYIDDVSDADVREMVAAGFMATTDEHCISDADVVIICVPTPLSEARSPNLGAVEAAATAIGKHISPKTLVVLESTTWPGSTLEVVLPIIEKYSKLRVGTEFHLAFSPERVDPGNALFGIENTPKVVGGVSPACSKQCAEFYGSFIKEIVVTRGPTEAEMTKLLENTYRHINIALVNEMLKFCSDLEIDFWDVVDAAATKPFGFQSFRPGPGVGGHCIPIDPNYLSHRVQAKLGYPFRFVELAQEINASMPAFVGRRISDQLNQQGMPLKGSKIVLIGVTYKSGIADERETPARPLAEWLIDKGVEISYYDPLVRGWSLGTVLVAENSDLLQAVDSADLAVVLQEMPGLNRLLGRSTTVLDTRGRLDGSNVIRL